MKKLAIISIMLTMILTLEGCSDGGSYDSMSKDELINEIGLLTLQLQEKDSTIETLQSALGISNNSGDVSPGISSMNDGSGNLTFNTYDSKMIFPDTFEFPNSEELIADPKVSLSGILDITPNSNWLTRVGGTSIELEHSTGISGLIKVGQLYTNDYYSSGDIQVNVLKPWFDQVTNASVSYQEIFVDNTVWGSQANTSIFIDEEPAQLKCGMFYIGDYSVTYIFTYRSDVKDANKDEVITNLINSMKIVGLKVSVK